MDGWVLGGGCVVLDDVRMGCCAVVPVLVLSCSRFNDTLCVMPFLMFCCCDFCPFPTVLFFYNVKRAFDQGILVLIRLGFMSNLDFGVGNDSLGWSETWTRINVSAGEIASNLMYQTVYREEQSFFQVILDS